MADDPYKTLGIASDADDKAITAAYRRLVRRHHPDRGGDEAIFKAVQRAYDLLSDPIKRADYDATGVWPDTAGRPENKGALAVLREAILSLVMEQEQRVAEFPGASPVFARRGIELTAVISTLRRAGTDTRDAMRRLGERREAMQDAANGAGNVFYRAALVGLVAQADSGLAQMEAHQAAIKEALGLLTSDDGLLVDMNRRASPLPSNIFRGGLGGG